MSEFIKKYWWILAIIISIALVYYLVVKPYQDEKKKEEEEEACKKILHVEWQVKLDEKKLKIYTDEMTIYGNSALPSSERLLYYEKWKEEALTKGIIDSWAVIEYGARVEAEKALIEEGYCKP